LSTASRTPSSHPRPSVFQQHEIQQEDFADDEPLEATEIVVLEANSCAQPLSFTLRSDTVAIRADSAGTATALVTIAAPADLAAGELSRPAVDLVAVLDVSGSMDGTKIELLRETLLRAVDLLDPADRLSIIEFSDAAHRLTPLLRMTPAGRDCARRAIAGLSAGGGTDIAAGLGMAVGVACGRRARNPVCAVLLLTDGEDPRAGPACAALGRAARAAGAAVSAFGYGADHDARLLRAAAEAGGGEFAFIESPAAVRETFGRCLGGLLSVAAQAVRLRLRLAPPGPRPPATAAATADAGGAAVAAAGATIAGVAAAGAQRAGPDGWLEVSVGDLYRGETRDVLVDLTVPAAAALASAGAAGAPAVVLEAEVDWLPPGAAEAERRALPPGRLEVRRPGAGEAVEQGDAVTAEAIERQRNRWAWACRLVG
jgi:Mg-chelatase subunit ChlD